MIVSLLNRFSYFSCFCSLSTPRKNLFEHDFTTFPHETITQIGVVPDPDDDDDREPTTPPSSPTHGAHLQTNALLNQVMQRLVGMSVRTFESIATSLTASADPETDEDEPVGDSNPQRLRRTITITPPSSPIFDGLTAPTPNTAMRAIKSSTFLRVSSLNPLTKAFAVRSPGEIPSFVNDFLRGYPPRRWTC